MTFKLTASARTSNAPNTHPSTSITERTSDDGDSETRHITLTETHTNDRDLISGTMMHADTAAYMRVDVDDMSGSDAGMDTSFQVGSPPQTCVAVTQT